MVPNRYTTNRQLHFGKGIQTRHGSNHKAKNIDQIHAQFVGEVQMPHLRNQRQQNAARW